MTHLSPERIAALADEPATLTERAHLADCVECGAELAAAQRLIHMALTDTPAIERPITSWESLGPALRAEGLITRPVATGAFDDAILPFPVGKSSTRWRRAAQIAAGFALLFGGAAAGRASAAWQTGAAQAGAVAAGDSAFESTSQALTVLERASNDYQRAVAFLATNDSNVTMRGRDAAELYQARLEALDQAVAATRAALYRAPADPVLNQYYLQTQGARSLTLRQLGEVVPVSAPGRTRF